jgi:hypothetical protein
MTPERVLRIVELLRFDDPLLPDFCAGYNAALDSLTRAVRFEDALAAAGLDRAARVADFADTLGEPDEAYG